FIPAPLNSGQSVSGFVTTSDSTCTAHSLACNNGTLTCDGSSTLTNCNYSSCNKTCATALPAGPLDSGFTPTSMAHGATINNTFVAKCLPAKPKVTHPALGEG